MSEYKQLKTRIWQDGWFLTLNKEEKLLWLFLLTNPYCHISGLYELPIPLITGALGDFDWKKLLDKFVKSNKIYYKDEWIYIVNYEKHQPISKNAKDNVNKSIKKHLEINKEIFAKLSKGKKILRSPLEAPCDTLSEVEVEVEVEVEDEYKEPTPKQLAIKFFTDKQYQSSITDKIIERYNLDKTLVENEIVKFVNYWTELNPSGKKQRWEMEKTFQIDRRVATWFVNYKKFNKSENNITEI